MVIIRERQPQGKESMAELFSQEGGLWKHRQGQARVGFAVDIGTTAVAVTAFDLVEKRVIGGKSQTNRQTALGADVMMRIMHSTRGRRQELQRMVAWQVEEMAAEIVGAGNGTEETGVSGADAVFSVVGNTAMCHLFLGEPVDGLAGYPFESAYHGNVFRRGEELGMSLFAEAGVFVLSGIAGHVGSDALAVIGAEKIYDRGLIQMAVDLGTNAEMIINCHGKLYVCSAAAGPAMEGKGVRFGMRAQPGAVCGVRLAPGSGNVVLDCLAGEPPKGLCSSGIIDAIAELCKVGFLKEDGYLLEQAEASPGRLSAGLTAREGERCFLLCGKEQGQREIFLSQKDIRNVQLAKGAIYAGIRVLLDACGITLQDVDEFVVAGALGRGLRRTNAAAIGFLPDLPTEKLRFAGNAAAKGAAMALLQEGFSEKMEQMAEGIEHIELAGSEVFQKWLMAGMAFRPM